MSEKIYEHVLEDLAARKAWEERQRLWYEMRHNGIRRRNKPYPGAADLHYPLADGQIDKLKPFYFSQIWGSELLAAFVSKRTLLSDQARSAASWFHYQMVESTNYYRESLSGIDNMLMAGNAVLKLWWDESEQELTFDAIDPVFLVVPPGTVDLQKADRITHIIQLTESAYRRNSAYKQEDDFIKNITGKAAEGTPQKEEEKYSREGITYGAKQDSVVLHETWVREKEGWRVHTYSPQRPREPVKPPFLAQYRIGQKPFAPFVDLPMEVKDKGYYASRGIPERVAAFEAYINRTWNEKSDAMTYLNRPLFTHEGETINLGNTRLVPGQIIGRKLQAVQMPTPAISFDVEMQNTRQAAEYLIAMPDFGLGARTTGGKKDATATEINAISQIVGMSTDLRARIFRQRIAELYRYAWSILREKKKGDLQYYYAENMQQLPADALHDDYMIQPDGSPDSWNKPARMQRAVARYQMFRNHPNIDQAALAKSVLQEDDAELVRELFVDPQSTAADQQEDQAMELSILEMGYPARVKPADDDALHIGVVLGRLEMMLKTNQNISDIAWQRMDQHLQMHLQQLQQRDPKKAKLAQPQIQRMQQAMQQIHPPLANFPGQAPQEPAAAMEGVS
jgi:hypothetical protein